MNIFLINLVSIINSLEDAELFRKQKLIHDSEIRIQSSLYEINVFEVLQKFFDRLLELKEIIECDDFKIFFKKLKNNTIDYNIFCKKIIENFKVDWAEFFNEISKRDYFKEITNFDSFLDKYGWKYINNKDKWSNLILKQINN